MSDTKLLQMTFSIFISVKLDFFYSGKAKRVIQTWLTMMANILLIFYHPLSTSLIWINFKNDLLTENFSSSCLSFKKLIYLLIFFPYIWKVCVAVTLWIIPPLMGSDIISFIKTIRHFGMQIFRRKSNDVGATSLEDKKNGDLHTNSIIL